jgi:hypothetical protein
MRAQSPNHRDQVVGGFADRQHGVVSREQLLAAGVGSGAIVRALDAGRLRPVFRGVYAVGHVALRREGWWMAALLVCGEGAALSHRTAATIWGLVTGPTLPIDVTTSTDHGRKHARITAHRMRLHPFDALVRDNLRVTTPSRTIVDLAASLEGRALRDAVPRRPGTRRLHDLITVLAPDEDKRPQPPRAPVPRADAQGKAQQLTAQCWRLARFTYEEIAFEPGDVAQELVRLLRQPALSRNARTTAR